MTRYVGFDATVFQSGETNHNGHISRRGPPLVRKYAVEAVKSTKTAKRTDLLTDAPVDVASVRLRELHLKQREGATAS